MAVTIDGSANTVTARATQSLVSGTVKASTSGTSIDFTGIPSWVKRITVMFNGVSTNGTSVYLIQIGSGSTLTTGYVGSAQNQIANIVLGTAYIGFPLMPTAVSTAIYYGVSTLYNLTGNTWVLNGQMLPTTGNLNWSNGTNASLGGALDRVIITTDGVSNTFDAGTINIMYE